MRSGKLEQLQIANKLTEINVTQIACVHPFAVLAADTRSRAATCVTDGAMHSAALCDQGCDFC